MERLSERPVCNTFHKINGITINFEEYYDLFYSYQDYQKNFDISSRASNYKNTVSGLQRICFRQVEECGVLYCDYFRTQL